MDASKSLLEFNKARMWVGGWVDGLMGGWVDGWMGGWVRACVLVRLRASKQEYAICVKVSVVSLKRIRYKNSDGWLMSVFG